MVPVFMGVLDAASPKLGKCLQQIQRTTSEKSAVLRTSKTLCRKLKPSGFWKRTKLEIKWQLVWINRASIQFMLLQDVPIMTILVPISNDPWSLDRVHMDEPPVHQGHIETDKMDSVPLPSHLLIIWSCHKILWRNLEFPEKTHACMMRTCKHHTERPHLGFETMKENISRKF